MVFVVSLWTATPPDNLDWLDGGCDAAHPMCDLASARFEISKMHITDVPSPPAPPPQLPPPRPPPPPELPPPATPPFVLTQMVFDVEEGPHSQAVIALWSTLLIIGVVGSGLFLRHVAMQHRYGAVRRAPVKVRRRRRPELALADESDDEDVERERSITARKYQFEDDL
jgi:hypothetical protein